MSDRLFEGRGAGPALEGKGDKGAPLLPGVTEMGYSAFLPRSCD
jgi:hypothetical protein